MSEEARKSLTRVQRLVVKVGTRVLVGADGSPDEARIQSLADQIARLVAQGKQVVFVSSGAIGAGMEALGLQTRPLGLAALQMAAAVGQSRLMGKYMTAFGRHGLLVGQVLLTREDLKERTRHLNARNTMMKLLLNNIVPIVNENDAVSVDEIRFGDNDQLASLVTMLVNAELLVLLTSTDGLRSRATEEGGTRERIPYLKRVTPGELSLSWGKTGGLSTGGMSTKLQAAQAVVDVGAAAVVASGKSDDVLDRILAGADVGTLIGEPKPPDQKAPVKGKKRWIAFFQPPQGVLEVDDGAQRALVELGRSLLPSGIRKVEGHFDRGAMVTIRTRDGQTIARGLVDYTSEEILRIRGYQSHEIADLLGEKRSDEVIHRHNLVVYSSDLVEPA